ncbi:MAG: EscU/YscU/HrcU family type III secretion system export apparatus switch protein [Burkholderiaceae bacterium]
MAKKDDGEGAKDQKPTAKRLRDARKKGQVSQSQELTGAVAMTVGLAAAAFMVPSVMENIQSLFTAIEVSIRDVSQDKVKQLLVAGAVVIAQVTIPIALLVSMVAAITARVQAGPVFSFEPVKPKLEKVNPAANAKQVFSMKSVVNVALMVLKSIVIGSGVVIIFYHYLGDAIRMVLGGLGAGLTVFQDATVALAIWAVAGYLMLACLDLAYRRYQFGQDMQMSLREIRREIKEDQGDPIIKSARKGLSQQPSTANQMDYVDRSNLLLESSDGRVIALFYRPEVQPKPIIITRAAGALANQVKEIAQGANVPSALNTELLTRFWPLATPSHTAPDSIAEELIALITSHQKRAA